MNRLFLDMTSSASPARAVWRSKSRSADLLRLVTLAMVAVALSWVFHLG